MHRDDPAKAGETTDEPSGVQLLLRGADGTELVTPEDPPQEGLSPSLFPSWALGVTLVGDAVLVGVAWWLVWRGVGWGRYLAAALLLALGAVQLGMAIWLRGRRALEEIQSLNPLAEEKPRLRVQFLDEQPRQRGSGSKSRG